MVPMQEKKCEYVSHARVMRVRDNKDTHTHIIRRAGGWGSKTQRTDIDRSLVLDDLRAQRRERRQIWIRISHIKKHNAPSLSS